MFKELGEFIDACGRFTADTIRTSANIIKKSIEDSDEKSPMQGAIAPNVDEISEILSKGKTITVGRFDTKTGKIFDTKTEKIVVCKEKDEND